MPSFLSSHISNYRLLGLAASLVLVLCSGATARSRGSVNVTQVATGDTPLNLVETPDRFLISTNSGYRAHYLLAFDETAQRVSQRLELSSLWYGLDYNPAQKLVLASSGTHSVFCIPLTNGRFGVPREMVFRPCELTAGVAFDSPSTALVACNQNHQVLKFDTSTGEVLATAKVGSYPYAVKRIPEGRVAISNWGDSSVSILDVSSLQVIKTIPVGSHPNAMLLLPKETWLLVACSDSDLISIIDLHDLREIRRLNIGVPGVSVGGAQPDALAFDADAGQLFVALAAVNAVAVLDVGTERDEGHGPIRVRGMIPVGGYPTAVLHSSGTPQLFIADGRNRTNGPSSPARYDPNSVTVQGYRSDSGSVLAYIGYILGGSIESLSDTDLAAKKDRLLSLAEHIYGSRPEKLSKPSRQLIRYFSADSNPERPIQHVVYVIKENRTYDQVFGDIKEGNGDSSLVLFGESVTPNQHALARQFVLFDNFYVDGDVSWDGHLWSTAGLSTDYVDKLWPATYSHRINFDLWGSDYRGDETQEHPIAVPTSGFIWDLAEKAGITYRDYGEWCNPDPAHPGLVRAYVSGLKGHYDPLYGGSIGEVSDQSRVDEWEREFRGFEESGQLPQLSIVYLPNDHTVGTRPGGHTPRAMVADNDLALGRLVDVVSHSRFWPSTAIFVLEDDAQDGPDHVDAHRSPLLVISPYIRRQAVEHNHFSTVSVLKTIEQILGLRSLTYFDHRAPSLLTDFDRQPVSDGFASRRPQIRLDEMNPPDAPGAKESGEWDFSHPDQVPAQALNRVIWQSIKGEDSEPPAPILTVQSVAAPTRWSSHRAEH